MAVFRILTKEIIEYFPQASRIISPMGYKERLQIGISRNSGKLIKSFNYFQVMVYLILTGCGAGREMSFDEFNTLGDSDMWLSEDERILPPLYEEEYIVGAKDSLSIRVRDHEEFSTVFIVNLKGEVYLPLIDDPLLLEGLTLTQAAESISHFLAPYILQDVICDVELVASGSRFYYVMGEGLSGATGGDSSEGGSNGPGSVQKIPMNAEPVYLRDLLLEHQSETNLEEITIIRPDLTDRRRPRFMTIDMSGIPRAQWNKNYRIRPNDIVVVHKNFRERVKDLVEIFTEEVNEADESDQALETTLRFLEARLQNDSDKKERYSRGR